MCGDSMERQVLGVSLMIATEEGDDHEGEQEVERQGDHGGDDDGLSRKCQLEEIRKNQESSREGILWQS